MTEQEARTEAERRARIERFREAVLDALGVAGWEINSDDELDDALESLVERSRQSSRVEVAPSDTDLLGFIDQTLYANRGSSAGVAWRNDEVLDLLRDVRRLAVSQPVQVEVTEANRALIAEVMQEDAGDGTVSWWRRRARRLAAALGGGE